MDLNAVHVLLFKSYPDKVFFPTLYKFYPDFILIYLDEIRIKSAQNQDKIEGHGRASTTLTKENVIWTLSEAKDPNRKNF